MRRKENEPLYDPEHGWKNLGGLARYQFDLSKTVDRLSFTRFMGEASMELGDGDLASTRVHAARFDGFIVVWVRTHQLSARWIRQRPRSRERLMYLFVNRGRVNLSGGETLMVPSERGGVGVVLPGSVTIDLAADEPSEFVIFSFDKSEVLPLTIAHDHIGRLVPQSAVFRSSFFYLLAMVTAHVETGVDSAISLRTLTRAVARAVVRESLQGSSLEDVDDYLLACKIIEDHAHDPTFDMDALAVRMNLSRRTVNRIFASNGLQPSTVLRQIRTQHARELLIESPSLTIEEVSAKVGFGSRASLVRAFHDFYQVSPNNARSAVLATQRRSLENSDDTAHEIYRVFSSESPYQGEAAS